LIAKFRDRLSVSRQKDQKCYMMMLNLKKLNEVEDKEQYHVNISDKSATLENLDDSLDISMV
jgi:hypothetical protein